MYRSPSIVRRVKYARIILTRNAAKIGEIDGIQIFVGKPLDKLLEDRHGEWTTIITGILLKYNSECGLNSSGSELTPIVGFRQQWNEISGFLKAVKFLTMNFSFYYCNYFNIYLI